jgi:hypothetical protein
LELSARRCTRAPPGPRWGQPGRSWPRRLPPRIRTSPVACASRNGEKVADEQATGRAVVVASCPRLATSTHRVLEPVCARGLAIRGGDYDLRRKWRSPAGSAVHRTRTPARWSPRVRHEPVREPSREPSTDDQIVIKLRHLPGVAPPLVGCTSHRDHQDRHSCTESRPEEPVTNSGQIGHSDVRVSGHVQEWAPAQRWRSPRDSVQDISGVPLPDSSCSRRSSMPFIRA